ncbi:MULTISPECIES: lasso RiPP family leader peptide-containing protein [Saccharopolyspora]|uniref:Lasso RiPP family leader peptide-containing protein n=1 Tax=Saccharopolyspora cebuensis TaxID=418759 RepID=A0ABV4CSD7_9PSEU
MAENGIDVRDGAYEAPAILPVGDFTEVTRIKTSGNYIDSPYGVFCIGNCG